MAVWDDYQAYVNRTKRGAAEAKDDYEKRRSEAGLIGEPAVNAQKKAETFKAEPSWERTNVPLAMRNVGSVQQQMRTEAFFDDLERRNRTNLAQARLINAQASTEEGEGKRRDKLTGAQVGKTEAEAGLIGQQGKALEQESEYKYGQGAQDVRSKESEANRSLTEAQAGKVKSEAGLIGQQGKALEQESEYKYGQGAQDIRKQESTAKVGLLDSETGLNNARTITEQGEGARRDATTAAQSVLTRQQAAVAGAQADAISAETARARRSAMSDTDRTVVAEMGGVATQKPGEALLAMERVGNQFPDGIGKIKDDDPTLAEVAKSLGVSVPEFRSMYERGVAARNRQAAAASGGSVGNAGRITLE